METCGGDALPPPPTPPHENRFYFVYFLGNFFIFFSTLGREQRLNIQHMNIRGIGKTASRQTILLRSLQLGASKECFLLTLILPSQLSNEQKQVVAEPHAS